MFQPDWKKKKIKGITINLQPVFIGVKHFNTDNAISLKEKKEKAIQIAPRLQVKLKQLYA